MNSNINKMQAVRELSDELNELNWKLERAGLILQELTEEYFYKYDGKNNDDALSIIGEFKRNSILADIISDYVFQARKILNEIKESAKEVNKEVARAL